MNGPKKTGNYVDRDIDCQEAVSQGVANLIEDANDTQRSEIDIAADTANASDPRVDELISKAVKAGWKSDEAQAAIVHVAAGIHRALTGLEPDE